MYAIDIASIRPDRVSIYKEFHGLRSSSSSYQSESIPVVLEELPKTHRPNSTNTGRCLSKKAADRLSLNIEWLVFLARRKKAVNPKSKKMFTFKVNFITLTLPALQAHTDKTIKARCLNQFLVEARKSCNLRNYVWRAECQKNGNIHFHIVSDVYLNAYLIRQIWNRQLAKLGYIQRYHDKFHGCSFTNYCKIVDPDGLKSKQQLLAAYDYGRSTNWMHPNSTDIHSVRKIYDLAAYLRKYVTKSPGKPESDGRYPLAARRISGKMWGCSQSLSKLRSIRVPVCNQISRLLNDISLRFPERVFEFDYVTSIYVKLGRYVQNHIATLSKMVGDYIRECGYSPARSSECRYHLNSSISFSP